MTPNQIKKAKAECERFLDTCRKLQLKGTHSYLFKDHAPDEREYESGRRVAAVKRASLDLQMVLIDLRMNRL